MPTLNIGGKRVKVGDGFLSLPPEQQNATVEEIAKSIGIGGQPQAIAPSQELPNSGMPTPQVQTTKGPDPFQTGAMQGMTLGFGDELMAGLMTPIELGINAAQGKPFDIGGAYNAALAKNRASDQQAYQENPVAANLGDLTGSVVTGGALAKGGLTLMKGAQPTIASMAGRGALEGALYGGARGLGSGDDLNSRIGDALKGAAFGGVSGGILGGIGGAIAAKGAQKAIPSVDSLKQQAGAIYDAAEKSGIVFPQQSVKTMADDMAAQALSNGIDPTLHPGATAALKRVQDAAYGSLTVQDARILRRVISGAINADRTNPDQARIALAMLNKIDDFLGSQVPELATANALYHRAMNGDLIETTIELARSRAGQFSGSGFENALRTEFRALERQIIKGQLKGLPPAVEEAIRKVAQGGPIENILRWAGKAAPSGIVSAGTGFGVPFAVGNAIGGPGMGTAAGLGTMGAGLLARGAATGMTMSNAQLAGALARSGGIPSAIPPQLAGVAQALIAGGGQEIPRMPASQSRAMALN